MANLILEERVKKWLKLTSFPHVSHHLDPVVAKLSQPSFRQAVAPLHLVRSSLWIKFDRNPVTEDWMARFKGRTTPRCPMGCPASDTQDHLLGGCSRFRSHYTARHDTIVHKLAKMFRRALGTSVLFNTSDTRGTWPVELKSISQSRGSFPDLILFGMNGTVILIEVGVAPEGFITETEFTKTETYEPLMDKINNTPGFSCQHFVPFIIGNRGKISRQLLSTLLAILPQKKNIRKMLRFNLKEISKFVFNQASELSRMRWETIKK